MVKSKKNDIGLVEIAGIMAAGKAVVDLDEVKKLAMEQAEHAKRQASLQEDWIAEQRDNEERKRSQEEEDEKKEKYLEYIEIVEEFNLAPFAAYVLCRFFEKGNEMSFKRALSLIVNVANKQNTGFLKIDEDPNSKQIKALIKQVHNFKYGDSSMCEFTEEMSKDLIVNLIIKCMEDSALVFVSLLNEEKEKYDRRRLDEEAREKDKIKDLFEKRYEEKLRQTNIDKVRAEYSQAKMLHPFFKRSGTKSVLRPFFILFFPISLVFTSCAAVALIIVYQDKAYLDLRFMSWGLVSGVVTFLLFKFLKMPRIDSEENLMGKIKDYEQILMVLNDKNHLQNEANDFYERKKQGKLSEGELQEWKKVSQK